MTLLRPITESPIIFLLSADSITQQFWGGGRECYPMVHEQKREARLWRPPVCSRVWVFTLHSDSTVFMLLWEKGGDFQESGCCLFSPLTWCYSAL